MTDPRTPPLIRGENLSRMAVDSGQTILADINVELFEGERVGLVGPTGSGKSTLLRAIALLDPGTTGTMYFRNEQVTPKDIPAYRRQVIYLPQRPAMAVGTVRKNLRLPFELEIAASPDMNGAGEILRQLGKAETFAEQDIDSLSGGERQIVALTRALQLKPLVLLLDEPTASLDAESATAVERMITEWQAEQPNRAYVWVSHDQEQVARVADNRWELPAEKPKP